MGGVVVGGVGHLPLEAPALPPCQTRALRLQPLREALPWTHISHFQVFERSNLDYSGMHAALFLVQQALPKCDFLFCSGDNFVVGNFDRDPENQVCPSEP